MREKTLKNRDIWREKIFSVVFETIDKQGLSAVTARDVAKKAEVTVGGLYLAYGTLDGAIAAVTASTLQRLEMEIAQALEQSRVKGLSHVEQGVMMAQCYAGFALQHRNLWSALFAFFPSDAKVLEPPRVYLEQMIGHIVSVLLQMRPDKDEASIADQARVFFAAVHGVVLMTLEDRFVGVPLSDLNDQLDRLVRAMLQSWLQIA